MKTIRYNTDRARDRRARRKGEISARQQRNLKKAMRRASRVSP